MKNAGNTIIIGGVSRLPKELSQGESLQAVVELESDTGKVVQVSFTPSPPIIEKMLSDIMIGMKLEEDGEKMVESIRVRLHHRSQKAYMAAIRDLIREYNEFKYGSPKGPQAMSAREAD